MVITGQVGTSVSSPFFKGLHRPGGSVETPQGERDNNGHAMTMLRGSWKSSRGQGQAGVVRATGGPEAVCARAMARGVSGER